MKRTLYPLLLLGLLAACGKNESAPTTTTTAPTSSAASTVAAADGDLAKGEHVYKGTCALCHAAGVGGAPKFGSKEDWAPRIAQGKETLYSHAIKGFTGAKGAMPAKGANPSLADSDVEAAVNYMVAQVK